MKHTLIAALVLALPLLADDQKKNPGLERAKAAIASKDTDGDGRLSLAEFGAGEHFFGLLDRDGDGFLTDRELVSRKARKKRGRDRPQTDQRRPMDREQVRSAVEGVLKKLDADGDGRLSTAELQGRKDLARADRNRDGFVDRFELVSAIAAKRGGGDRLKKMDSNGDGKIDRTEWRGPEEMFARLDADKDGLIGPDEMKKARGAGRGRDAGASIKRLLKQMDVNQDGQIDSAEWKGRKEGFARLDADKDGVVTKKELARAQKAFGRRGRGRAGEALFRRADKDRDGKISRGEWPMRPELFRKLDADNDGFITRKEVSPRGPRRGRSRYDERSGKDSQHFLAKYDKNGDGSVTGDEFKHERRFAEIDANGDGTLSQTEIEDDMDKRRSEKAYGFLDRYDLNEDGKVTREEFTGPARIFEAKDKNHDGVVDAADKLEKR